MLLTGYLRKTGFWKRAVNAPAKAGLTITENETPCKNPRKKIEVLDYTLPSRPAVFKMSQDFAMISYKDMTESITTSSK